MSKRWGKGKLDKKRKRPKICVTCGANICYGEEINSRDRNTPKVCQTCRNKGISSALEWGCSQCMTGDPDTGIFNHYIRKCPGLKQTLAYPERRKPND